jgi:hypothetical protein
LLNVSFPRFAGSNHAKARMRQRGVTPWLLELLAVLMLSG